MRLSERFTKLRRIFQTFSREFKSKLAVGSSRISKLGSPMRAKPMESFLLHPWESVLTREFNYADNPTLSVISSILAFCGLSPWSFIVSTKCSRTVISSCRMSC
jgi:hypothetical protein